MKTKIVGYENYELYDSGDLINLNTHKQLKGKIKDNGYRIYTLSKNNQKKDFYVHRLVAEYFVINDDPENKIVINHKDGNKLNNDYTNLEWCTYSENNIHANKKNIRNKNYKKPLYYDGDLEGEEWKEKIPYDNYLISNYGRVLNLNTERLLQPNIACGYQKVTLSKDGKTKGFILHHLVFELFSGQEIPKDYVIDHIDGNKLNNCYSNLRIVSRSENVMAALYEQKTNNNIKPVQQFDLQGNYIATFRSCAEAARVLHLDSSTISKVCRGINKTHGGFKFQYK